MRWSSIRSIMFAVSLVSFVVAFAACTKPESGGDAHAGGGVDSTMEKNVAGTRDFIERAFNKKDTTAIDQYFDPSFVERNPMPGQPTDINGMKMFMRDWTTAFPDVKVTIDDIIAQGDKVVIRNTLTGTNTGPFMGQPPTGKSVKVEAIDIVRIKDGKVVEHWGQADVVAMMKQMGMMPPDSAAHK